MDTDTSVVQRAWSWACWLLERLVARLPISSIGSVTMLNVQQLALVGSSLLPGLISAASSTTSSSSPNPTATYINFAAVDILDGDDGLPTHPFQPQKYGKWTYPITTDGNGREQVEAHVTYYENKYYMHAATWGCGGSIFVYGQIANVDWPVSPVYPPGDYGEDGNCGIKSYSSSDFTNWELATFYQPSIEVANVTKPVVRYSNATGQYVMFMGGGALTANFYYATSDSPGGPWSDPPRLLGGMNISHDFDVAVGPDGTHYMVSDVLSGLKSGSSEWDVYVWDIYIHQLTPNLTSTVGTAATSVLVRSAQELNAKGLTLEASGFFYHDGYWYLTFGYTCQNCAGYIYYYYATDPLGPYTDGGFLSQDGCGGQNKGANVLPTPDGGQVILAGNLGYRTSPSDIYHDGLMWHSDNHQAASSTFFFPLEFNDDHTIKNFTCPATATVPLMVDTAAAATVSPSAPVPYQLDCRVRNGQDLVQTYSSGRTTSSNIEFPVWQRTWNLGPTTNAGPVLDGYLHVSVGFSDGESEVFSWPSSNISWAPGKISLPVGGKTVLSITLSTNATNGCYGTLAQPSNDNATVSAYGTLRAGEFEESTKASLYVYQF